MQVFKTILSIYFLILSAAPGFSQQSGHINGTLLDSDGIPVEGVAVQLMENEKATVSTADGTFELTGLKFGTYTVFTRALGYDMITRRVTVDQQNPAASINLLLPTTSYALQEVELLGRKRTTYNSEYSFIGTKTASRVIDVPQTISTVTKELMDDQQAFTLNDVMQNIAGVNQYSSYDDLTVRGFRNGYESGFRLVNGLRSGYSYGNGFFRVPLLVNLERVEVLKGPGAALFGDINPGGTINMVTKKPLKEERKSVNFSVGSFQTSRATLDFTGPLNEKESLLYRLNIGFEDTQTFRDYNDRQSLVIAPSVTFLPSDRTSINAEIVYSSFDGSLDRGLPIEGGDLYALSFSFAINQPNDYFKVQDLSLNASLNHKITDALSFNLAYMKFAYTEDLREHRTLNTFIDAPLNTVMNIRYFERIAKEYTDNLSAYISLSGNTGSLQHQVVAGADYIHFEPDQGSTMYEARQQMINGDTIPLIFDLQDPVYEIKNTSNYVARPTPQFFIDYVNAIYNTTGIYIQDQIEVTDRFNMLLGLRYELFRDERDFGSGQEKVKQDILLPRAGLTYTLVDNLNYFASYSQGFKPVNAQFVRFPERYGREDPFQNETSYQVETGLKGEFFNQALFGTFSLYQIEKRNTLINTGIINEAGNPIYRQNGKALSRGAELELVGNIGPHLSLNANYAYNHTEIVDADVAAENGRMAPNAPKHSAGVWAKYNFTSPKLRGLGIALGGNGMSKRRMELQVTDVETGALIWDYWPGYITANAAVSYRINKFKISFNLNNIFDKQYFVGGYDYFRASPGAPGNFMTSIGYMF